MGAWGLWNYCYLSSCIHSLLLMSHAGMCGHGPRSAPSPPLPLLLLRNPSPLSHLPIPVLAWRRRARAAPSATRASATRTRNRIGKGARGQSFKIIPLATIPIVPDNLCNDPLKISSGTWKPSTCPKRIANDGVLQPSRSRGSPDGTRHSR